MPAKQLVVQADMGKGFAMESSIGPHLLRIDQPKSTGGTDTGPTPLDYFLLSLAGCIGAVGRIIANQRRLPVHSMRITVTAEIDTDGLLGKATEKRIGFSEIAVEAAIEANMSIEEKRTFLEETKNRCPISDNISNSAPVTYTLAR